MIKIKHNHDLASMTTFRLPAKAAAVAEYDTTDELLTLLRDNRLPRPFKPIGQGSNLLFVNDFPGTILHNSNKEVTYTNEGGRVIATAAAGVKMDDLCHETVCKGLWGLENLSGIPGEAGASAVQNVGAYGVEAGDIITEVRALDLKTMKEASLKKEELGFAYRDSMFKHDGNLNRYIITSVSFGLSVSANPRLSYANLESIVKEKAGSGKLDPTVVRRAVTAIRDSKLPSPDIVGSAGSFFKNPVVRPDFFEDIQSKNPDMEIPHFTTPDGLVKIPAAWLIDKTGWKGAVMGNAGVWERQPLVIVNLTGKAASSEIIAIENAIAESVYNRFGIKLTPEVEHIAGHI